MIVISDNYYKLNFSSKINSYNCHELYILLYAGLLVFILLLVTSWSGEGIELWGTPPN